MAEDLKLDRRFMNTQFSSWRLQRLASVNRYQICATGHASGVATTALDFLHTRASVLRNHLLMSEGRLFVFTQSEHKPGYLIYELLPVPASDHGLLASQVAELGPDAEEGSAGGAVEALVDCSLAVVAEFQGIAASVPADAGAGLLPDSTVPELPSPPPPPHQQLLLSRGRGDLVLMRRYGDHVSYSNAVHPLRPRLPYTGVRPLILEAAFAADNGDITAVVWAMRGKGPRVAACCEVFAVTLRPREDGRDDSGAEGESASASGGAAPGSLRLDTVDARLLLRTKLPPYLVRVLPTGAQLRQHNEAPSPSRAADGGGVCCGGRQPTVLVGFDPSTSGLEDAEEGGGGGGAEPMQVAVGGGGAADDEEGDMDPRTLEQAAARLAHLTSEEREGAAAAAPAQWADVYKESGPDGLGALGDEPALDLAAWRLGGGGGAGAGGGDGGESAAAEVREEKPLAPFWRLCCGAHRLLTAEGPLRCAGHHHQHHQSPPEPRSQPQPLLLGVTDDVDCAVLRVDCCPRRGQDPAPTALAQERQQQEDEPDEVPQVHHVLSIPALAYVAAGKTYKRHLLLTSSGTNIAPGTAGGGRGGEGGAGSINKEQALAAVLVESQRFMYLYSTTTTQEEYGRQQVVELGLEEGEQVLGARLVEAEAGELEEVEAREWAGGGAPQGTAVLVVVATQRRLLSYRLRMQG